MFGKFPSNVAVLRGEDEGRAVDLERRCFDHPAIVQGEPFRVTDEGGQARAAFELHM